jgi:hypothetical protein
MHISASAPWMGNCNNLGFAFSRTISEKNEQFSGFDISAVVGV